MLGDYLKEHSRKDHDQIENSVDLVHLATQPDLYLKTLKAFYGYYLNLEKDFLSFEEDFKKIGIDLKTRLKKDLLVEDLKHFNLTAKEIENLPICSDYPVMNNIHEAIGVLYVLEGSTMGGQIIFKQLLKNNIIEEGTSGGNFFKPYGNQTMPMWMSFKESLNQLSSQNDDLVLNKARETFNTMEKWLLKSVK